MLAAIPRTVQEAWGETATTDFSAWLERVMTEQAVGHDDFTKVEERLDDVDVRLTKVEERLENVEMRLTLVESGLADLKTEVRQFRQEITERMDRLQAQNAELIERLMLHLTDRSEHTVTVVDDRLDRTIATIDDRLDRMQARFDDRFDRLQAQMAVQTRWSVGVLALFGTIIAMLVGIAQLTP